MIPSFLEQEARSSMAGRAELRKRMQCSHEESGASGNREQIAAGTMPWMSRVFSHITH